jgi:hypothetical protein
MSVGMPQYILLQQFGQVVQEAFGYFPYHVGSSLAGKTWRDVDVRLILPDDEYQRMFGAKAVPASGALCSKKWCALCLAFATLGKEMTGLPIDFQIQQQSEANKVFDGPRSALILSGLEEK